MQRYAIILYCAFLILIQGFSTTALLSLCHHTGKNILHFTSITRRGTTCSRGASSTPHLLFGKCRDSLFCSRATATTSTTQLLDSKIPLQLNLDNLTDERGNAIAELPSFGLNTCLPDCQYTQVLSTNDLSPLAEKLRQYYDEHFQDPRQPNANRFIWDPWFASVGDTIQRDMHDNTSVARNHDHDHVSSDGRAGDDDDSTAAYSDNMASDRDSSLQFLPGEQEATLSQTQYSLKRIQSNNFFTEDDFSSLVDYLTLLGRSIGLTAITPPWISMYTHGDMQNFHTDAPHGPMAFVFSLCKENHFRGGETMLLRPSIMEMWKGFDASVGLEAGQIMRYIPPTPLGRCVAFDPRVPHGVNPVIGMYGNGNDPRYARVVVNGWFNQPEICYFGSWEENEIENVNEMLEQELQNIVEVLGNGDIGRVVGYLACKIELGEDGDVVDVVGVCDTLQADWDDFRGVVGYDEANRPVMEDAVSDIKLTIYENLKNLNFGVGTGRLKRSVVVPFLFE